MEKQRTDNENRGRRLQIPLENSFGETWPHPAQEDMDATICAANGYIAAGWNGDFMLFILDEVQPKDVYVTRVGQFVNAEGHLLEAIPVFLLQGQSPESSGNLFLRSERRGQVRYDLVAARRLQDRYEILVRQGWQVEPVHSSRVPTGPVQLWNEDLEPVGDWGWLGADFRYDWEERAAYDWEEQAEWDD